MAGIEVLTVDEERVIRSTEARSELIHDPTADPGIAVLDVAAKPGHFDRIEPEVEDSVERQSRGNLDCRR